MEEYIRTKISNRIFIESKIYLFRCKWIVYKILKAQFSIRINHVKSIYSRLSYETNLDMDMGQKPNFQNVYKNERLCNEYGHFVMASINNGVVLKAAAFSIRVPLALVRLFHVQLSLSSALPTWGEKGCHKSVMKPLHRIQ